MQGICRKCGGVGKTDQQEGSLGCPVPGRTRAVLLARQHNDRMAFSLISLSRIKHVHLYRQDIQQFSLYYVYQRLKYLLKEVYDMYSFQRLDDFLNNRPLIFGKTIMLGMTVFCFERKKKRHYTHLQNISYKSLLFIFVR